MGSYLFKFFWIILYSQYLLQCITYCLLRYHKEEAQLVGLFFKKDVLEFVAKILLKYTNNEFLKIPFQNWTSSPIFFKDFDHNYYNNSSKYAANRTLFFQNICYSKHKKWQSDVFTFPEEILKRNYSLFWVLAVSKKMK